VLCEQCKVGDLLSEFMIDRGRHKRISDLSIAKQKGVSHKDSIGKVMESISQKDGEHQGIVDGNRLVGAAVAVGSC